MFAATSEQIFYGLFLVAIAGFYLAFTAHFGDTDAWGVEAGAVAVFAVIGVIGCRIPAVLMVGYFMHGIWDLLHELRAHAGLDSIADGGTEIPLAYGAFCAAYDVYLAAYSYLRRYQWNAAWARRSAGTL